MTTDTTVAAADVEQQFMSEALLPSPRPGGDEFEPQTLVPRTKHGNALTELTRELRVLKIQNKLRELGPVIDLYIHIVQLIGEQADEITEFRRKVHELEFPTS